MAMKQYQLLKNCSLESFRIVRRRLENKFLSGSPGDTGVRLETSTECDILLSFQNGIDTSNMEVNRAITKLGRLDGLRNRTKRKLNSGYATIPMIPGQR